MTDLDEIARLQEVADAPRDARALVSKSGLAAMPRDSDLMQAVPILKVLAAQTKGWDSMDRLGLRDLVFRELKRIGVAGAAAVLDAAFGKERRTDEPESRGILFPTLPEWPDPVDGVALLDSLENVFTRYVVLPPGASHTLALWVVFAHAHDAFEFSPLLGVMSPERRCGKTTVLILLGELTPRSQHTSNITAAAMYRAIEQHRCTLLVDEADAFLHDNDSLRSVLNGGHRRATANVVRTSGEDHLATAFNSWGPKAVACIGRLHATTEDRAIMLPLRRKGANEHVERLRLGRFGEDFTRLNRMAARWAEDHLAVLAEMDPATPTELHDRARDNWAPLFAIADATGGAWPEAARRACRALTSTDADDLTASELLLADIRDVLNERSLDRIYSDDLAAALGQRIDRPWSEWRDGQPISQRQLALQLARFGIKPRMMRLDDQPRRGYERARFADAFVRYLAADPQQPLHPAHDADSDRAAMRNGMGPVALPHGPRDPHCAADVADVADGGAEAGMLAEERAIERAAIQAEGDA